jgi:hypothetical protein
MSTKAGQLLWNRRHIHLESIEGAPVELDVDTGLCQVNKAFDESSNGEPSLGVAGIAAPAPGTLPASRVQVIPMAPTGPWALVTHSEPWYSTVTDTVHVTFFAPAEMAPEEPTDIEINVLFWDPHTGIGPGQADPYGVAEEVQ